MKVLQVVTSLIIGGAEKLIVDTVPLYQKKGLTMDVLSLRNKRAGFWKVLEKTTSGSIIGLTKGSVYNPLLIFKIIPYLKKYDLIHVHLFPALYWVVLAKWISFSKTKLIFTEHSTDNRRMNNPLFRLADLLIYKGLYQIITISEKVDENIKDHLSSISTSHFTMIHNGIPVSRFVEAQPLKRNVFFDSPSFLLIQVAYFRKEKDQKTLIKALLHLPENIKLLLAGNGVLKKEHENLVEKLNLQNRVLFLGNREDIPNLLKTADITVLSSHYEGLSLSSLEGMAAGPLIASNVPGLKEIVEGYGLLFEEENEKDLAEKIMQLYKNPTRYTEIKERCRKRAEQFDIHKMVDRYLAVYQEAIQKT